MFLMAVLSPKARALLNAGRVALQPSDGDRERVQSALHSRLGPVLPAPRPRIAAWQWVSGAVASVGLAGGALFLSFQHGPSAVNTVSSAAPPSATVSAAPAVEPPAPLAPSAPAPSAAVPAKAAAPSARSAPDSLAQEVALLSRATSELHRGNPAGALQVLNEHLRKFPNGLLGEERRAAKAQALCALGRKSEGRAELAHLAPQSPAAAHARQVCGSDAEH
jgi:hypothetical protein